MTIVKASLYPREALDKLMSEDHKITIQLIPDTDQEAVIGSQLTPEELAKDDLFKQAKTCVIGMNKFCYQKKQSGATDIAEVDFLKLQPSHCCFMAPYGSTCLGTMCKMKSNNIINMYYTYIQCMSFFQAFLL